MSVFYCFIGTLIIFLVVLLLHGRSLLKISSGHVLEFVVVVTLFGSLMFFCIAFCFPQRGLSLLSNIIIIGILYLLLLNLMWGFLLKDLTKKEFEVFALLCFICILSFIADQDSFSKLETSQLKNEVKSITTDIAFSKNNVLIIDISQPSFTSSDVSILEEIDWKEISTSHGKDIICSISYDDIAIMDNKILCYTNIPDGNSFIARNTLPTELLFKNPINLGLVADDKNIPYFKYALLKHDSSANYVINQYALCNGLTYEVTYFEELPDFAQ